MLHNTAYQSIYTPPGGQVECLVGVGVGHQEPVLAAPPGLLVVAVVAMHPQPVQDTPLAAVHLWVATEFRDSLHGIQGRTLLGLHVVESTK